MPEIFANDLIDLVREVENDIEKAIQPILAEFQTATGFSISDIWCQLNCTTGSMSSHPEYKLTKVNCEVALRE